MSLRRYVATTCLLFAAGTGAAQIVSDYADISSAFTLTGTDSSANDWGVSDMGLDAPTETDVTHLSDAELDALIARWITQPSTRLPAAENSSDLEFNNLLVIPEDKSARLIEDYAPATPPRSYEINLNLDPRETSVGISNMPLPGNGTLTLEGNVYFIGGMMVCILARGTCAKVLRWVR